MSSELPARCVPCEGGIPALTEDAARQRLVHVPRWSLEGGRLRRSFRPRDFRTALAWVNRVGMLAEEQGHHPDVHLVRWNHVEFELWTHAAGGLTDNDFVLAREIDALWERPGSAPAR